MREIKFRAWDKKGKKIYQVEELGCGENPYQQYAAGKDKPETGYNPFYPVEVELMQFTGLLDKNGKEIYEGDIITAVFDDGYYGRIGYTGEPKCKGLIKWDYCGFMMELLEDDKRYLQELVFMEDKEIIGNIYENPDLLTSSQSN